VSHRGRVFSPRITQDGTILVLKGEGASEIADGKRRLALVAWSALGMPCITEIMRAIIVKSQSV